MKKTNIIDYFSFPPNFISPQNVTVYEKSKMALICVI